ncbi:hypothetical protein Uis1B_2113 [Bifidobacterium margollesii]|uniref:Uncharacterized protein n=1 Tax=Bifidobacterium margollesii TaxID=2020964 RepID=A0A2N5J782_9BIFI|nr:hypothetical protein [Bifidobacterium margollesii]PLS30062.1 hypothetical protein Uis1B_2113 [Bifidobacterium margollesii]
MKHKLLTSIAGLGFSLAAGASAFAGFAPWITALLALCAGLDCLRLGLFGCRDD